MDQISTVALASAVVLLGGFVKGTIGFGLPLITVGLLSVFLPVKDVIGLLAVPILVSNVWQAYRSGGMLDPVKRFWPLLTAAFGGLIIGVYLLVSVEPRYLYAIIGGTVVVFSALMLANWAPKIAPAQEKPFGFMFGGLAGVIGGLSTIWAPPITLYLLMLDVKKEQFIQTSGTMFFIGGVPVVILYIVNDIVHWGNVGWSAALLVPVFLGMMLGQKVRDVIPQETFRKIVLVTLIVVGGALLRRSFT
ncbi:MAG: sulfite exporter TauE/SafE family protein [Rhodospirillales bacterium]